MEILYFTLKVIVAIPGIIGGMYIGYWILCWLDKRKKVRSSEHPEAAPYKVEKDPDEIIY